MPMMTKKLSLGIILLAFGGSSAVFAAGRTNEVYGQDEKNKPTRASFISISVISIPG